MPDPPPHRRGLGRRHRASRSRVGWDADPFPETVGQLRRKVRAQLAGWGVVGEPAEVAVTVVSELSANAVEHAGTPFHLSVSFDGFRVRVLVRDSSREPPRLQQVDHATGRGRGLQMIDRLCVSWDWMSHPDGKTVWALLRSDWPS